MTATAAAFNADLDTNVEGHRVVIILFIWYHVLRYDGQCGIGTMNDDAGDEEGQWR